MPSSGGLDPDGDNWVAANSSSTAVYKAGSSSTAESSNAIKAPRKTVNKNATSRTATSTTSSDPEVDVELGQSGAGNKGVELTTKGTSGEEEKDGSSSNQLAQKKAKAGIISPFKGAITFKDVSFAYPSRPDVPVLKNLSLEIPVKATYAFVGSSGAGKSTVLALLERFYDATSGEALLLYSSFSLSLSYCSQNLWFYSRRRHESVHVLCFAVALYSRASNSPPMALPLVVFVVVFPPVNEWWLHHCTSHAGTITVDGVDLKSLDPRYLRRHVALVAQEPVLFAMTVAQNIAYGYAAARGNPDATPTRAEVQVHGW